jgi:hypothetical protein
VWTISRSVKCQKQKSKVAFFKNQQLPSRDPSAAADIIDIIDVVCFVDFSTLPKPTLRTADCPFHLPMAGGH